MLSPSPPCGFAGSGTLPGKRFFQKKKPHTQQNTIKQAITSFAQRHRKGNGYRIEPPKTTIAMSLAFTKAIPKRDQEKTNP